MPGARAAIANLTGLRITSDDFRTDEEACHFWRILAFSDSDTQAVDVLASLHFPQNRRRHAERCGILGDLKTIKWRCRLASSWHLASIIDSHLLAGNLDVLRSFLSKSPSDDVRHFKKVRVDHHRYTFSDRTCIAGPEPELPLRPAMACLQNRPLAAVTGWDHQASTYDRLISP